MEKDQIELPKITQLKYCRLILRAITKLMFLHFFKAEEFQRPKNIANLLSKATDYLKLWYHFLQLIFSKPDTNNNKSEQKVNPCYSSREEFCELDLPDYFRKCKKIQLKKNIPNDYHYEQQSPFSSPRINKIHETALVPTFSEKIEDDEENEGDVILELENLPRFKKSFYCKEFAMYFLKINICWAVYYQKSLNNFKYFQTINCLFRRKDLDNHIIYLNECDKIMSKFNAYEVKFIKIEVNFIRIILIRMN